MLDMLASRLEAYRKYKGHSQITLAALCELHQSHISNIETARAEPKISTIAKILTACPDLNPEYILCIEEAPMLRPVPVEPGMIAMENQYLKDKVAGLNALIDTMRKYTQLMEFIVAERQELRQGEE